MSKLFTVEEDLILVVLVKGELRNTDNGNEWICVYVDLRVKHISMFQKENQGKSVYNGASSQSLKFC